MLATMDAADYEAVERALEACGLSNLAERPAAELSGGQRQRAFIAMVLAQDTPVVLFDEPTSALDPEMVGEVLDLMRDLATGARDAARSRGACGSRGGLQRARRVAARRAGKLIRAVAALDTRGDWHEIPLVISTPL